MLIIVFQNRVYCWSPPKHLCSIFGVKAENDVRMINGPLTSLPSLLISSIRFRRLILAPLKLRWWFSTFHTNSKNATQVFCSEYAYFVMTPVHGYGHVFY